MKQRFLLLLVCYLMLTSNSQATISCSNPKLSKPVTQNSIYHFKAVVVCELIDENINLKTLNDAYLSDIVKKGSQFKVHKQHDYNNSKGMTGYLLDVTQSYNSSDGAVSVRADIIISNDQTKNFYYELRTKSIAAEGDAKYEKMFINTTKLELLPSKNKLTVTKEIDVEEPWYAPESVFLDTVESKLKESIRKAALVNAQKICGQNVDALRK